MCIICHRVTYRHLEWLKQMRYHIVDAFNEIKFCNLKVEMSFSLSMCKNFLGAKHLFYLVLTKHSVHRKILIKQAGKQPENKQQYNYVCKY